MPIWGSVENEESKRKKKMSVQNHHEQLQHQLEQDQDDPSSWTRRRRKGGFITMPFIIANESFEKVASYGLLPNMILYLMKDYKMSVAKGTSLIFFWSAATNFTPIIGAFVADSFLGRFLTIGLGSITSFLGMSILWLTTIIPTAKPPPCNPPTTACQSPSGTQYFILILSFILMSIGAGGVRPCSQAFGADQLDRRRTSDSANNNSNNQNIRQPENDQRVLETFFNWYYACSLIGVLIALTVIVYIQDHLGWRLGFGIPALLMLCSAVVFFVAYPFYVRMKPRKSLFTSFAQVVVAAFNKRGLVIEAANENADVVYYYRKDSYISKPTERLRFLNKACMVRDPEQDIALDGSAKNPWNLCTVEEVEELKSLIRVIPIWSTGIMLSINTSQNSFPVLQATSMDRHLGSNFQIPAGSFGMFFIIVIILWVPVYDRVIIPLASKIKGKPVQIHVKVRMGAGLLLTSLAMLVSGIVENVRRNKAIKEGFLDNPQAVVNMSAMWLVVQYCLNGLAEAFTSIAQTEFFYTEFPKSMSSIATSLFTLGMAVANLLASAIVSAMDSSTKRGGGKDSWVSSNINRGRYDYYYWTLAVLSFFNFFYYVGCSWAYGPCTDRKARIMDEANGFDDGDDDLNSVIESRIRESKDEKMEIR